MTIVYFINQPSFRGAVITARSFELPEMKGKHMHFGLFIPIFGDYADARVLASLAQEAETSGWEGFFLWDHVFADWPGRSLGGTDGNFFKDRTYPPGYLGNSPASAPSLEDRMAVFLAIDVQFKSDLRASQLRGVIDELEKNIHKAHGNVGQIFIEMDRVKE